MDDKTAKMKSELSQLLENLPDSQTISSDVWQIREILGGLGVLEQPNSRANWPKSLSFEEIKDKIGQKVYFVNKNNPKHDTFGRIQHVNEEKDEIILENVGKIIFYGHIWEGFDQKQYELLSKINPKRFNKYLPWDLND